MIKTHISDGSGTGRQAAVTENNALRVQVVPETSKGVPPDDLANLRLLRRFLLSNGGGSPNMNINGAVTPTEFLIGSELGVTKWVTSMRILLEGASLEMNTADFRRFGASTTVGVGLANGLVVQALQSGVAVDICAEPIRFVGDFFSYSDRYVNFINAVGAQSDFLAIDFDFDKPVVLAEGGSDKLSVFVSDNLSALEKFQVIVRGYEEFV